MKKYLLIFGLFLTAPAMLVNAQNAKQYQKVGEEFLQNNKVQDAIDQFTKAIDLSPDFIKAYESRAKAYEMQQEWKKAAADFEKLSIFDPKNAEYLYNTGRLDAKSGDYEKALEMANKTLEVKKTYVEAIQLKVESLIALERYNDAIESSKEALRFRENEINFWNHGKINEKMGLLDEAQKAYENSVRKNGDFIEARVSLADLQRKRKNLEGALKTINDALKINKDYTDAYLVRSRIYAEQLKYSEAINDISTILLLEPQNEEMFMVRGVYYQGYAQHMNAISDFSKVISLNPVNAEAYFKRASSYEQVLRFDDAIKDYRKIAEFADNDKQAKEMLAQAEKRLYELNRESDKPTVDLTSPVEKDNQSINVPKNQDIIPIVGIAKDASQIKEIKVNDMVVPFTSKKEGNEFLTSVNFSNLDKLKVDVTDIYDNTTSVAYTIVKTEVDPPVVRIIAPYASDNNLIYLDTQDPMIYVEGTISDESLIKAIYINDLRASYVPADKNPNFQAMVNIQNRDRFTVTVEDEFGNKTEALYMLNREGAEISAENPMGKTWVVFIENSNYQSFASLEGPTKDITMMKTALAKYSVHNFIHKKDMTKQDLEKFFAIELRDLIRSNRVNSLLVWYAGHGKFVNETGYWVPVDARRDDEFTYYNINALKASMQSYPNSITHKLVITDACESGPSFYQAMRSGLEVRSCNDWGAVKMKSAQVFSSAGYELAVDNSQFTRTFANVLANNPDACLPIESVVQKVTDAVVKSNQQKPQFGKIAGLEDENGTFFFISK
jgi:tetratricopeptide (TPR) repeat protein